MFISSTAAAAAEGCAAFAEHASECATYTCQENNPIDIKSAIQRSVSPLEEQRCRYQEQHLSKDNHISEEFECEVDLLTMQEIAEIHSKSLSEFFRPKSQQQWQLDIKGISGCIGKAL